MNRHWVAKASDIPEGTSMIVKIGNVEIGIYNIENQFYALKSVCPHQKASLCKGVIAGTNLPSKVNEYNYGREGEIVRCPWHNWEFEIKTGRALFDESVRVATYKTIQEGEDIALYI